MLDLSDLRDVRVDPDERRVRVSPGATLGDVDRHTQAFGLAVPTGIVSETGIAGLALGGGHGWLSRKHGYTCDNLLSADVVTATGELVTASQETNPELFWALRGGGGNFGVVTSFEFRAHPLGPEVMAGLVAWPFSEAARLMEIFRERAAAAPPELTYLLILRPAPPAPFLPEEVHGELIAAVAVCWAGDPDDAEEHLRPLREHGEPLVDGIMRKPFLDHQKMLDAAQPKGRRYYWKSEYTHRLDDDLAAVLERAARGIQSPHSAILVFQFGGAIARVSGETATSGRDAAFNINVAGSWEDPTRDDEQIAWAREAWQAILPHSTDDTYVNFLTEDESEERARKAYAGSYGRLSDLKARFDPDDIFKGTRNIRPATRPVDTQEGAAPSSPCKAGPRGGD